jgi:membrane-bound serine protease (ClpP class)
MLSAMVVLGAGFCWALLAAGLARPESPDAESASLVVEVQIDDVIHPIMAEHVGQAFTAANERKAKLILITMNTPGGLDSSMREIIQRIINSPIPVAVYVSPSGTRAASAGFYILLSADIAAMAPGTDTGAASPIFVIGGQPIQIDETLRKKAINEAAAYLRSITTKRGRNAELAEKAITEAKAFTDHEALENKLIDLVAASPEELLAKLHQREIRRFDGTTTKLELENPIRSSIEMSARQKFLSQIADPNVLFILFLVGMLGLYIEFSNPGLILPGVVGAVSLILAMVAAQILPINALGVLLLIAAVVLFVMEAKFTSHGLLGAAGVLSMVIGAIILIRSPITGMRVSLPVILIVTFPFALISVVLMRQVIKSYSWRKSTGMEQMIGETGQVTQAVETPHADGTFRGMAFVHGELWSVAARQPLAAGTAVRVTQATGLTLLVEPVATETGEKVS